MHKITYLIYSYRIYPIIIETSQTKVANSVAKVAMKDAILFNSGCVIVALWKNKKSFFL